MANSCNRFSILRPTGIEKQSFSEEKSCTNAPAISRIRPVNAFSAPRAFTVQDQLMLQALQPEGKYAMMMAKTELSNETILLKESNNKLLKDLVQKERECRDIQDRLILASKTNSELMDELAELTLENQRCKLQGMAIQDENNTLHNQLSHIRKMYMYSFPKGPISVWEARNKTSPISPNRDPSTSKKQDFQESWEEVSEKLLKQMQQEMFELSDMNLTISLEGKSDVSEELVTLNEEEVESHKLVPSSIAFSDECELECAKSLIHHLKSQVEHLRTQAISQGALLKSALEQLQKFAKTTDTAKHSLNLPSSTKRFSHPSDELFRAYFTKQLHKYSNPAQNGADEQTNLNSGSDENPPQLEPQAMEPLKTNVIEDKNEFDSKEGDENVKVCPICEVRFAKDTLQVDFENHVFEHLDQENTLLLEQYEMV